MAYENWFLIQTVKGELKFYIGDQDAATDRSCVTIAKNVSGELKGILNDEVKWNWC